jgi:hypothetical protein
MNYILLSIPLSLLVIGYIQFKRAKEQVNEVGYDRPETERELTADEVRKINIVQRWATRMRNNIYDEMNPTVVEGRRK